MKAGFGKEKISVNIKDGTIWNHTDDEILHNIDGNFFVSVLFIQNKGVNFLIISFDLIGLSNEYCEELRVELCHKLNFESDNIFICWTHTHTAPATFKFQDRFIVKTTFLVQLKNITFDAVTSASKDCVECEKISFSKAHSSLNKNRIYSGRISDNNSSRNELDSPYDDLNVVCIERNRCKPIIILNYACHPLSISEARDTVLSPDFPGYTNDCLEKKGFHSIFLQGFAGNLNPKIHGGINVSRKIALSLSDEVMIALQTSHVIKGNIVKVGRKEIVLNDMNKGFKKIFLQVLFVGEIVFLFCPGEPFYEIAVNISDRVISEFPDVFIIPVGYSNNGNIGYIPELEYYDEPRADYETRENYYWYRTVQIEKKSAKRIEDGFVELIRRGA